MTGKAAAVTGPLRNRYQFYEKGKLWDSGKKTDLT